MTRKLALLLYCLDSFALLFGLLPAASAQVESSYSCLSKNNNYTYQDSIAYKFFLENTARANTEVLGKQYQQDYYKTINDKNIALLKQLNDKSFLFDTVAYPYLLAIFNNILDKNGLDRKQFHFFVDRTSSVNAYSYEDGTIVCNLGLLTIMENESQLTMVFCHELGHYLLKHVNSSITARLVKYDSPEFLARVKKIKSQRYNSKSQLEGMMMDDVFDRTRHGRSQERAADSLGILLFRNTGYDGNTVSRVFDVLDRSDNSTTFCTTNNFFKSEGLRADEAWFKPAPKMSFGGAIKKEFADSLKTHPDCPERKITMQAYFDKNPKPGADFLIADAQKLSQVKQVAFFAEAAYSKQKNNLGFYFYQLMQLNTQYPLNTCIKTEIFETLITFCKKQRAHTLYMVVPSPYIADDDHDEYAKLLRVLDNMDLDLMSQATVKYYQHNKPQINASAEVINNLNKLNN